MTDDLLTEFRSAVPLPDEATAGRIFSLAIRPRRTPVTRRRVIAVVAVAVAVAAPATVLAGAFDGRPSPAEVARNTLVDWEQDVRDAADAPAGPAFTAVQRSTLVDALEENASRYGYTVQRVDVLRVGTGAPIVVVRYDGSDLSSFSHALPSLLEQIDPRCSVECSDLKPFAYEGLYFEAVDAEDVPFVIVTQAWLTSGTTAGSQWARAEDLYPFVHL